MSHDKRRPQLGDFIASSSGGTEATRASPAVGPGNTRSNFPWTTA